MAGCRHLQIELARAEPTVTSIIATSCHCRSDSGLKGPQMCLSTPGSGLSPKDPIITRQEGKVGRPEAGEGDLLLGEGVRDGAGTPRQDFVPAPDLHYQGVSESVGPSTHSPPSHQWPVLLIRTAMSRAPSCALGCGKAALEMRGVGSRQHSPGRDPTPASLAFRQTGHRSHLTRWHKLS